MKASDKGCIVRATGIRRCGLWVAVAGLLAGGGCGRSGGPGAWPSSGPPGLIVRVDAVQVAPYHPGTTKTWDGPAAAPGEAVDCGLVGKVVGFINPIAGKGAQLLCALGALPRHQEQDPSAPDLAILLSAGVGATYETSTARDTTYAVFHREFLVPTAAIPPEGLSLKVIDRDGETFEIIGHVRLGRQQLLDAAFAPSPVLTLADPTGGLQRIELVVTPTGDGADGGRVDMQASQGTTAAPFREIRAGEVIEIVAAGRYRIGHYHDDWIDPRGYPGGGPRSYNFAIDPFQTAPHGAALGLVAGGDAQQGFLVAPCSATVARVGGKLVVGLNDNDPANNTGELQFSYRVRPPTPEEWSTQQTAPCPSR